MSINKIVFLYFSYCYYFFSCVINRIVYKKDGVRKMEDQNIEKILTEVDEDFFIIKQNELEDIEPDIPSDPSPALIKKLLGELPSQIEYLKNKSIECKKRINNLKLLIKTKKHSLEIEKSRIRKESLENYQKELKQYLVKMKELFTDVIQSDKKVTKSALQEMVRALKPEKPTKNDLDDIANLQTEDIQQVIFDLEMQLTKYEEYYELLHAKAERYENKFIAARAHKGILVEEMKNHI